MVYLLAAAIKETRISWTSDTSVHSSQVPIHAMPLSPGPLSSPASQFPAQLSTLGRNRELRSKSAPGPETAGGPRRGSYQNQRFPIFAERCWMAGGAPPARHCSPRWEAARMWKQRGGSKQVIPSPGSFCSVFLSSGNHFSPR